jgi:hypothetical protein
VICRKRATGLKKLLTAAGNACAAESLMVSILSRFINHQGKKKGSLPSILAKAREGFMLR